jgi:DNA segregation ATPase FtsK/SpoIIIE-like protein
MSSTRLRKLQKGFKLKIYKNSPFIRQKMKYFLQANDLYKVEEQKVRVNDNNVVGGKSEIQLSLEVSWKKEKNEYGDLILIIKLHKDGSVLESRIEDSIPKLQALFGKIISQVNSEKYYEVRLFLKQSDYREEIDVMEEIAMDPQGFIQLDKYHKWQYRKYPNLLLAGNVGTGKSRVLYGMVYKLLSETEKENLYICDGKNDELYELCKDYLKLPNVESDSFRIGETVKNIEKIMEQRYENKERNSSGIFLVIDEFAALRIALDKKEFAEINDSLRRIILMGRAANIHIIMALQRPETSVLDGAIRDNYPVRIGLGNLKDENFKMVFGITKDDSIIHKEIGQGYISINDVLDGYESPWVILPWDKEEDAEESEEY